MSHRFCVAPMMDRTDRHCRYFHRLLTEKSLLYTEMFHSNAILKGNTNKAKKNFGYNRNKTKLKNLIKIMMDHELKKYNE